MADASPTRSLRTAPTRHARMPLADLIGRSVARVYNNSNKIPPIHEVYPSLFSAEEIKEARAKSNRERFIAGLQQFAQSYNKQF